MSMKILLKKPPKLKKRKERRKAKRIPNCVTIPKGMTSPWLGTQYGKKGTEAICGEVVRETSEANC